MPPIFPFRWAAYRPRRWPSIGAAATPCATSTTDETAQLDTLTKAIRTKGYSEAEKKQLYLLLLGYFDIAASIFALLETHVPRPLPPDEEWAETDARFDRIRRFARLNVKGIAGLLTLPG